MRELNFKSKLWAVTLLALSICPTMLGQSPIRTVIGKTEMTSRLLDEIPQYITPADYYNLQGTGKHKYTVSNGSSASPSITANFNGNGGKCAVSVVKFRVDVELPAHATYQVTHNFELGSRIDNADWGFSELQCYDSEKDLPDNDTYIAFDMTTAASGTNYAVRNGRAYSNLKGYKKQQSCTRSLKYINTDDKPKTISKYFLFISYACSSTGNDNGFDHTSECILKSSSYYTTHEPIFTLEKTYRFAGTDNAIYPNPGKYDINKLKDNSIWKTDNSPYTDNYFYSTLINDNKTITIQQKNKNAYCTGIFQVFSACINIPANSDFMAKYNFLMYAKKDQTNAAGWYIYEIFDLGEDPNSMFEIGSLNLSYNDALSDDIHSIQRQYYLNDINFHKSVGNVLYIRYQNQSKQAIAKKHYFAILLYNIKAPAKAEYLKRIEFRMEMENYDLFPTVYVDRLNQFSSDENISNMSLNEAAGYMGIDTEKYMKMKSDPRTITISTPTENNKSHIGYVPFTLTETLNPGTGIIYKLFEYRTILNRGSFSGKGGRQTVELFNFGPDQPKVDRLDLSSSTAPSNGNSLFKVVNENPNDSISVFHRVVIPFEKKGSADNLEYVDANMALVTSTPVTGTKKPGMQNRLTDITDIAVNSSTWIDMTQNISGRYKIFNTDIDQFTITETSTAAQSSSIYIPFEVSTLVAPNTSIWKIVSIDFGIQDSEVYGISNAYVELFNFGSSDKSGEVSLNKASNANASSSKYSERRIFSEWGYNNNHRTVNILMQFKNDKSVPAVVSNHMALLSGTNDTAHKHKFRTHCKITSSSIYDTTGTPYVFFDSWQDTYGFCSGSNPDDVNDIRMSQMGLEGNGWTNNNGPGNCLHGLFDEPSTFFSGLMFTEQVNNFNDARYIKFSIAAVVPPHSTLDATLTSMLQATQTTNANPQFSAELFYFGESDRSDELTFNVVGELGSDNNDNAVSPANCYPSDLAFSKCAVFDHTANLVTYTSGSWDAKFVNDTDQPKLVRRYMGLMAYCQAAYKEHPWYKFWESDTPLQHKLTAAASISTSNLSVNRNTEYQAFISNVKTTSNTGFNKPVVENNSIAIQESGYSQNSNSATMEFDMAHFVQANSTDNVKIAFKLKGLNRKQDHKYSSNFNALAKLWYQSESGWTEVGTLSNNGSYSYANQTYSITLPFSNSSKTGKSVSRHFKLECSSSKETHLSLFRLEAEGAVTKSDSDYSYELCKDNSGLSFAKIVGFNKSNVAGDRLPESCLIDNVSYPVKALGNGALRGIQNTELHIPGTMTVIEAGAFVNCTKLETMIFERGTTPCTIFAYHNVNYYDDNLFNQQTQYTVNNGSLAQGCPNLKKVIFNRQIQGAEPNGNSIACSPFATYDNKTLSLDDITTNSFDGLLGFMKTVVDYHIGSTIVSEFRTPVKDFVFTSWVGDIGNFVCMNAKGANISFVVADDDTIHSTPHFNSIGAYAFNGTGIRSFDFSMAENYYNYAFANTPIEDIEITPNVSYIGVQAIASNTLFNLKIDYSPIPLIGEGGDRWGNNGILDEGLDHYTCSPDEGEWRDYPVTFLKTLDIDRDITLNTMYSSQGPFQATMFEQNLNYDQYDIGNLIKTIYPSTFKSNNFEYFRLGNGVQSVYSEGMSAKTLHSLKIGTGLSYLDAHAFQCQDSKVSQEFIDQLMEAIKEDALKDAWWNDIACVYSNSNFDFSSVLDYSWTEWANVPIIHDIYCEAVADKQTTPTTNLDIFTPITYQYCTLRYTSPELTGRYPWNQFANTRMVVPMEENQYGFKTCLGETESDTLKHVLRDVEIDFKRSYKKGWNTLCIPFDCTADALADGLVPYTLDRVIFNRPSATLTEGSFDLDFKKVDKVDGKYPIRANIPYLVWFESDVDDTITTILTNMDLTIDHGNPLEYKINESWNDQKASVTMCGTYHRDVVPEGGFILSGGKFYEVDSYVEIKGFRAWFHVDDGIDNTAKAPVRLLIDGNVINGSPIESSEELVFEADDESLTGRGYYYDAFGRKVTSPIPGKRVYIRDGKKVLF